MSRFMSTLPTVSQWALTPPNQGFGGVFFSILLLASLADAPALAGEFEVDGFIAPELRIFPSSPAFADQKDTTLSPSIAFEIEAVYETDTGDDRLTFTPFARFDADDNGRSHGDIRTASWLHIDETWDAVVGFDKVFWGVTESRHLVDIINQDDAVEDIDGEDKLGQPMINGNLLLEDTAISLFVLPGFRQRRFREDSARLRGPFAIDDNNPTFESAAGRHHIDVAARVLHTIGNWDIGLSHFHGTSREPSFTASTDANGNTVLFPSYEQIDQTGLEIQLTTERTLWKLEAITRSGHGDRFFAAVGGFEYTLFGILDSDADLGLIAEYLYDGRDESGVPATLADDDIFIGARLVLNDEPDTQALIGAIIDRRTRATSFSIEAERRLGADWKIELESRFFVNVPDDDLAAGIRDDDVITLRLPRFF